VPAWAPSLPPETVASITRILPPVCRVSRWPRSRTSIGEEVEEMMRSRSSKLPVRIPSGPTRISSTWGQVWQHQHDHTDGVGE
jgi:hypothetical protein